MSATDRPVYQGWRAVPAGLVTATQLADHDLPRRPAGPVRAYVETTDWRGRRTTLDLYAAAESQPSAASAARLAAAARRRDPLARVCRDCGAVPELPPRVASEDPTPRCTACLHIARLRRAQAHAHAQRPDIAAWARRMLADTLPALVLHVARVLRPPAPSGRQDPRPIAVVVDAVDHTGAKLLSATVRATDTRVRSMPVEAVQPAEVAGLLTRIATGPTVTWSPGGLAALRQLVPPLDGGRWPSGWSYNADALAERAAAWRADINPDTAGLRIPLPPGRADRMWLLLHRMAHHDAAGSAAGGPDGPDG